MGKVFLLKTLTVKLKGFIVLTGQYTYIGKSLDSIMSFQKFVRLVWTFYKSYIFCFYYHNTL